MKIEDVIKNAIKMEEEGHDFYKKAEGCTADHFGKLMYSQLAEDELRHKVLLQGMLSKVPPEKKQLEIPLPKERLRSVFEKVDKTVCERVPPSATDMDALEFAMGKEKESYQVYRGAADSSADPGVKAVFVRMAQEEDQHFQILENTRYILKEFENWSLWEEGGPIEGG